jgi:hypothetical protein
LVADPLEDLPCTSVEKGILEEGNQLEEDIHLEEGSRLEEEDNNQVAVAFLLNCTRTLFSSRFDFEKERRQLFYA